LKPGLKTDEGRGVSVVCILSKCVMFVFHLIATNSSNTSHVTNLSMYIYMYSGRMSMGYSAQGQMVVRASGGKSIFTENGRGKGVSIIGIMLGVSKVVEDGRRLPALRAGHPWNGFNRPLA
jgi:hypothetical protein